MQRGLAAALIVVGMVLVVMGVRVSQSLGSEMTEAITGAPSDRAIWLLVAGIAATVIGVFGMMRRGSRQ